MIWLSDNDPLLLTTRNNYFNYTPGIKRVSLIEIISVARAAAHIAHVGHNIHTQPRG